MIMMGAATIAALVGISGARDQQIAANAQNKIAGQQLKFNNEIRAIQQREIIDAGDQEANNINAATRGIIGQQKVGYAGQGVDVNSEVAIQLKEEARANAQADAKAAKSNAAKRAWGIEIESSDATAQNQFDSQARTNTADAMMVNAGVSGMMGIVSAGASSKSFQKWWNKP